MKKYINPTKADWKEITKRPAVSNSQIEPLVKEVFEIVEKQGDSAISRYTKLFDHIAIEAVEVKGDELVNAAQKITPELKKAIGQAASNIEIFHSSQKNDGKVVETNPGVLCWQESRAIEKIGIYIPGGTAPLFSTVLMLGIPAKIAGCPEIVLCTPPNKQGEVDPAILYAANLIGIRSVFKVGGIQAIAAMTYGTETIPAVYKIFGPGNQYVTAAKQFAQKTGMAIDMPAGPSELLVMADETASAAFIASDLLSQAEHGPDSQVVCVAANEQMVDAVLTEIEVQLKNLPRKAIAEKALENSSFVVISNREDRVDFVNSYAPEHLIITEGQPESLLAEIKNAGSVFLGNYTPESAGDYASGTNHTLPTNGYAKAYTGVNLDAFVKKITVQQISKEGLLGLGETIMQMASAEQLEAHKNAVLIRLKELENDN